MQVGVVVDLDVPGAPDRQSGVGRDRVLSPQNTTVTLLWITLRGPLTLSLCLVSFERLVSTRWCFVPDHPSVLADIVQIYRAVSHST